LIHYDRLPCVAWSVSTTVYCSTVVRPFIFRSDLVVAGNLGEYDLLPKVSIFCLVFDSRYLEFRVTTQREVLPRFTNTLHLVTCL